MSKSITNTIEELHSSLSEYIEATYHISHPLLVLQRRELLNRLGVIHQQPYLESTPKYSAGDRFNTIPGIPASSLDLYEALATSAKDLPKLIFDPPYKHQWQAVQESLVNGKNLIIMTGTGSGKTESFLLPILGKLAREANESTKSYNGHHALRAMVLYPMNALVNDQLGRLRKIFSDERLTSLFLKWGGRVPTFARYTSRTPYPGVRDSKKDQSRFKEFDKFYVAIEQVILSGNGPEKEKAIKIKDQLLSKGKWPSKPSVLDWFGKKGERWQDTNGNFVRGVTLPGDSELLSRQEVQQNPPDLMITNYSMLEYMLMRPIERTIFEKTKAWLSENPNEKFLIVLDEAHLYRGASGAEVGLLLRRLRERLDIPKERFQVICSTASFDNKKYAPEFASHLSGVPSSLFVKIDGEYLRNKNESDGSFQDATALSTIDLTSFYLSDEKEKIKSVKSFLTYRGVITSDNIETSLHQALKDFGPLNRVVNITMGSAKPIANLSEIIFPNVEKGLAEKALTVLLGIGSLARANKSDAGLLPCRVHNFFRGLPGLWICMDPDCSENKPQFKNEVGGKLYGQPRERCDCGARVFEYYTCRNCGGSYVRAYTDNILAPSSLWSNPGRNIRLISNAISNLQVIDLLLETPLNRDRVEKAYLDLITGRLNSENRGDREREVFIKRDRNEIPSDDDEDADNEESAPIESPAQFIKCGICNKTGGNRGSSVQDHQTKGDQPFLSLISRQIQIQPPNAELKSYFSPLAGRKVLIFSDSRQLAAKLAPSLQMYSLRDALRPLLVWGFKKLQENSNISQDLCLDDAYLAILIASNHFGVRLRPELKASENFYTVDQQIREDLQKGYLEDENNFFNKIFIKRRVEKAPEALLQGIVNTINDRFLGLDALALGSLCLKDEHVEAVKNLPNIIGVATTDGAKIGLANYWIKSWQRSGVWLKDMPPQWWKPSESLVREGVQGHKTGNFKSIKKILGSKANEKVFIESWLPELRRLLTENQEGVFRITGKNISIDFGTDWVRCKTCTSVHRPIPGISKCLECSSELVDQLFPEKDEAFIARKGYYRNGVKGIFASEPVLPMALIAAEHTAQLNSAQSDDIFSKAEQNELLFQDINIDWPTGNKNNLAIDILSSTTTMEVGIDIGSLSGAALRNMPPGRANYQQRAGRAGRRGTTVATVIAFGSSDSHDEHYFSHPEEMISGPVVDPILTLDNIDIIKRHILAFLLQKYHQEKLPVIPSTLNSNLFSVLGKVKDFLKSESILSRNDFVAWATKNESELKKRTRSWIPSELSDESCELILKEMLSDSIHAIDDAIDFDSTAEKPAQQNEDETEEDSESEVSEESDLGKLNLDDNLLNRLLYRGKLPRYAFPTDVAPFYVFDPKSSPFRPVMKFSPSQSLPIALSQYAPERQVWISNKCYTSGAIYSPIRTDRMDAWKNRRLYFECENCGFAKTEVFNQENKNQEYQCPACDHKLKKALNWLRPPGFAHPFDRPEETSPESMVDVSYATRAKLFMPFTADKKWVQISSSIRGLKVRSHLLVSNTGPSGEGYLYCVACGRIEAASNPSGMLNGQHSKPFPDHDPSCQGSFNSTIVLGTDFITDIGLFTMQLGKLISLPPGYYLTDVALRTMCEALSKAASILLEIEQNDIIAEYRAALTHSGKNGEEIEIFLYDTLPGGAGFATQLVDRGEELFKKALEVLVHCPEACDSSCYRCLRSFRNKFEHGLLDRHIGSELINYILSGAIPHFDSQRIEKSTGHLFEDLIRNETSGTTYDLGLYGGATTSEGLIIATTKNNQKFGIAICSPLTPTIPANHEANEIKQGKIESKIQIVTIDEFLIRNNLPSATKLAIEKISF